MCSVQGYNDGLDVGMDCIERAPLNFKTTLVGSSSSSLEDTDDWVSDVEDDMAADFDDPDCPVIPVNY